MQDKGSSARRDRGDGHLSTRPTAKGGERWVCAWHVDGRLVARGLGFKKSRFHPDGLTRPQAEAAFRRLRDGFKPEPARPQRRTVAEVGAELIQDKRNAGRKVSTVESIDSILRTHITPFFGVAPIDKITEEDVQRFDAELEAKGLSPKTRANALGTLHNLIEFAARRKYVVGPNPVRGITKPRSANVDADIHYLAVEEVEALLRAVPDDALGRVERVMYLTAAMTGMRQGELFALRWRDIDWTARRIRVRRNFVRGEFGTPKSKRSSRSVPLASRLAAELERLYQDAGSADDDGLVFAHPATGKPIDRSKLLKRFKAAVTRARVGRFETTRNRRSEKVRKPLTRFHDLRHTFGTRMAAQGVPMRVLQEMMGHRDFKTTLIYADYAPSAHEAEWVEEAFAPPRLGAEVPAG